MATFAHLREMFFNFVPFLYKTTEGMVLQEKDYSRLVHFKYNGRL